MKSSSSSFVFSPNMLGVVALQIAAITIWVAISPRYSFSFLNIETIWGFVATALMIALIVSWFETDRPLPDILTRARAAALGFAFMIVAFVSVRFLNHLLMSIPMPMADDTLDSWDKALGFDWPAYASWLARYEDWLFYARVTYTTTSQVAALLFAGLIFAGRVERAREFGTLLFIGVSFVVLTGWILPANGAMMRYGDAALASVYGQGVGMFFVDDLTAIRGPGDIVLSFANLPGLVSFPSFHTVCALLFIYACRDSLYTLIPASLWSGVMLMMTPVYGGHYLIDIVAGVVVTAALVLWSSRLGVAAPRLVQQAVPAG